MDLTLNAATNPLARLMLAAACLALLSGATHGEALAPLRVQGTNVVDGSGAAVSMRGINFGGWLMMESWIPSIEREWHDYLPKIASETDVREAYDSAHEAIGDFNDDEEAIGDYINRLHDEMARHASEDGMRAYLAVFEQYPPVYAADDMDRLLRKRFGDYGAAKFWNTFHDTWITEADFQLAKALGFNFVRLPFWYRWFEEDDTPYEYNEYGFAYLERAVAWAEKHGLYVMLDLHGAPGGQSPWDHTGYLSRGTFFETPEYIDRAAALWKAIAERFKDNDTVWSYDLLNEPFSAKDQSDWAAAHDKLYDAIREVDPDTIIIMEDGYKLEFPEWMHDGFFPEPDTMGWKNIVYSFHFYSGFDPVMAKVDGLTNHEARAKEVKRIGRMEQRRCNVPIYIGEFSTMGNHPNDIEGMRTFLTMFNELGWHWSPWTWKYVDDDNEGTIWGVYQYGKPWERTPDFHRDSLEEILDVVEKYRLEDFILMEPYGNVLRECLVQPVNEARGR